MHLSHASRLGGNTAVPTCLRSPLLPLILAIHTLLSRSSLSTDYQLYDALIIALALEAGCTTLFSENLHDSQAINGRLTIRTPCDPDK